MNKKEMTTTILYLVEHNHKIQKKLECLEYSLSIKYGLNILGGKSSVGTKSCEIEAIKRTISMLTEALGYELKPETTTKEPAKFVKKGLKK